MQEREERMEGRKGRLEKGELNVKSAFPPATERNILAQKQNVGCHVMGLILAVFFLFFLFLFCGDLAFAEIGLGIYKK